MAGLDRGWFAVCILAGRRSRIPAPLIQLVICVTVGGRFLGLDVRRLAAMAGAACSVVAVQITLAVPATLMMSGWPGADPLSLRLADAPGGLAEMSTARLYSTKTGSRPSEAAKAWARSTLMPLAAPASSRPTSRALPWFSATRRGAAAVESCGMSGPIQNGS